MSDADVQPPDEADALSLHAGTANLSAAEAGATGAAPGGGPDPGGPEVGRITFDAAPDDEGSEAADRAPAPVAAAVLAHITRSVVDDPDAVDISAIPLRAGRVRLAVRVAPNDFGRLIGRRGRVAGAVRTLVGAAAVKDGVDVEVEFVE